MISKTFNVGADKTAMLVPAAALGKTRKRIVPSSSQPIPKTIENIFIGSCNEVFGSPSLCVADNASPIPATMLLARWECQTNCNFMYRNLPVL